MPPSRDIIASSGRTMTRAGLMIVLAVGQLSAVQGKHTFVGTVTDSMCERADHSRMRMGPTDADCTRACVTAHDALYVLFDGKTVYKLSDQQRPETFAGQKVSVVGSLDAKTGTIQVDSISAAK